VFESLEQKKNLRMRPGTVGEKWEPEQRREAKEKLTTDARNENAAKHRFFNMDEFDFEYCYIPG
jgi:hypothetical protein